MADVVGGDLALVFLLEQIQREGDFPGQISQQVGDIVLEEARLRRVSAQAADHFAVPAQGESRRRANRHAFGPFAPRLVVWIAEEIVADHGMAQAKRHARWAPTFRQAGIAGSGGGRHIARGLGYRAPVRDGAQPAALRVDEPDTNQRNLFECGHDLADLPEQLPGLAVAADDGGAGSADGGVEIAEPDDFPLRRLLDSHIADGGDRDGVALVIEMPDPEVGGKNRPILAAMRLVGEPLRPGSGQFGFGCGIGGQIDVLHRQQLFPRVPVQLAGRRVDGQDAPVAVVDQEQGVADGREHVAVFQVAGVQRGLDRFAAGDVLLDGDEMRDRAALVPNGRDRGQFPVQRAVLAPIAEFAAPFAAAGDSPPQPLVLFPRSPAGFEKARIGADGFGFAITGDLDELGIDVLDGAVAVGDDDQVGALLDGPRKEAQSLLGLPPFPRFGAQVFSLLKKRLNQPGQLAELGVLVDQRIENPRVLVLQSPRNQI